MSFSLWIVVGNWWFDYQTYSIEFFHIILNYRRSNTSNQSTSSRPIQFYVWFIETVEWNGRLILSHSVIIWTPTTVDKLSLLYIILLFCWIVIQFKFKYLHVHFDSPDRQLGIVFNERTASDDRYIYFFYLARRRHVYCRTLCTVTR